MDEKQGIEKQMLFGGLGLFVPPFIFFVMFNLPKLKGLIEVFTVFLAILCLIIPPILGIYLLTKYFSNKTGIILLLGLLNLISPLWLIYISLLLLFKDGANFRINM